MKKLFSLFSMLMLLSSNALTAFTYADSGDNELAIQILTEEVNNVGESFNNKNNKGFTQDNDNINTFSIDLNNAHIVYDDENKLITVYTGDYSYGITLKDRNLGAYSTGDNGYYYANRNGEAIDINNLSNINFPEDYDNLSRGMNDNYENNYGRNLEDNRVTNAEHRQWVCEEGYHVPSIGELRELAKLLNNEVLGYLNFPKSGIYVRNGYDTIGKVQEGQRSIFTSTFYTSAYEPSSNKVGSISEIYESTSQQNAGGRIASPIRCFKNIYIHQHKTITFNPNGGSVVGETTSITDDEGKLILPNATREPDINGEWVFEGWFEEQGISKKVGNSGDIIEINNETTLYAHWSQTITFFDESNPLKGFTILDRNLGAVSNDINSEDSYGFYYQFGSNHGHLKGEEISNEKLHYETKYDGHGYDGPNKKYINTQGGQTIWEDSIKYNNIWGGGNDGSDDGYDLTNYKAKNVLQRQGPCPKGYHIPSKGEIQSMIQIFGSKYQGDWSKMTSDLKLPKAGSFLSNAGYERVLLTSSSYMIQYGTSLAGYNSYLYNGYSVRCFKNEYIPHKKITYNANGGVFSGGLTAKVYTYQYSGTEIIPIYNIQIPNRGSEDTTQQSGWMFAGWYTKSGELVNNIQDWGEEFNISNPQSTIAYAKWLPFNDLDLNIIGLPGIKIMDRNMGAEGIADGTLGTIESNSKLGYYYQWGNNYGFKNNGDLQYSDITNSNNDNRVDGDEYGPNNYYYSNTFKKIQTSPFKWTKKNNKNLWGGENATNSDIDKQGPCPKGYHIPDTLERKTINFILPKVLYKNECSGKGMGECLALKLKLPYAGYRYFQDGNIKGKGNYAEYRTSSPYLDDNAYYLYIYNNNVILPQSSYYRAYGLSVRCFKDNLKLNNLTFNLENGESIKYNNLKWRETIDESYKPEDQVRENAKFLGRVKMNGNEIFEFGTNSIITGDTNLYPKFKCNTGYIESLDGKSCEKIKINFYLNTNTELATDLHATIISHNEGKEGKVTRISHTPNIDDNGNFITHGGNQLFYSTNEQGFVGYSTSYNESISINGNNEINVSIKYRGRPDDWCGLGGGNGITVYSGLYIKDIMRISPSDYPTVPNYEIRNIKIKGDTVSFSSNGGCPGYGYYAIIEGTGLIDVVKYNKTDIDNLQAPNKKGYTFGGWYYTGLIEEFNPETVSTGEIVNVFAKWNPHHYTIQFNINGGTGLAEDINATYGEEIQLPIVSKEGYTFKGWKSEVGTIYNNIIPEGTGATTEDGIKITLTAQWIQNSPSAGGGQSITPIKQETKVTEQEHNSADTEDQKTTNTQTNTSTNNVTTSEEIKQQVKKVEDRSLTRGEIAIMTNILLEVYPQLVEGKQELDDVTNACSSYADEQNFTKDEKKAITRLCKLSIMGIHNDTNEPLEEFLVNNKSTNDEFSKVINRSIESYNEKDLSTIKDALKKLEGDEENVVFGTVYDVFMSIKSIFN